MNNRKHEPMGLFKKVVWGSFLVITAANIIFSFMIKPLFVLNENQLLYLFSSMAQIIGGILGLTLTAYVFFVDKFKESTQGDDTYYDASFALLGRFFQTLGTVAECSGLTILICILGIISLNNWTMIYPFVINQCVCMFVLSLISIIVFGVKLLDPEKVDKEIEWQVDSTSANDSVDKVGDFTEFLKYYNMLQETIIEFASSLVRNKEVNIFEFKQYKPQIIQSLRILVIVEVISGSLREEIDNLRRYRNGLVHGVSFTISQNVIDRVVQIYNAIGAAYDTYKNSPHDKEKCRAAIREIHNLTRSDDLNEPSFIK